MAFVAAVTLSLVASGSAQITELRQHHEKEIACPRSEIDSFELPCGIEESYESIFIGAVQSVTEISKAERRLQVTPKEIFRGNPADWLTVTTSKGACLPELKAGDEWLFYLERDKNTKELVLAYDSPSAPIAKTQKNIALLRRLLHMTNTGVIHGFVAHRVISPDGSEKQTYLANHKIVAKREDGTEYVAVSDRDGNYEFKPLPVGSYHLTANTAQELRAQEGNVDVEPRGCSFVGFELYQDGMISGRITTAAGEPLGHAEGWVAPQDGGGYQTLLIPDEKGYFEVRGLAAGRYLVWVEVPDKHVYLHPEVKAYYPGVYDKNLAVVIELRDSEKRTHIDFQVPLADAP